jgi:hypothetical protein
MRNKHLALVVSGGGGAVGKTLVDVVESWNGFHNLLSGNAQGQISDGRGEVDTLYGGSTTSLFPAGTTGSLLTFDAATGRVISPWTSAAGITSVTNNNAPGAGQFSIPIHLRFAQAESIPAALWPRPFRRYRLDFLVRGTVGPGAADCSCGVSCSDPQGMVTGGGITHPFVAWVARGALNAGRWTPRVRLVNAGAITDGPDSGISFLLAAYTQLSIVYEEGIIPRIRWLINGREIFQIAGDANMPNTNGSPQITKAMGAGAGVTACRYAETRFRCEEI